MAKKEVTYDQELQILGGVTRKKSEKTQVFLKRLVAGVDTALDKDEAVWDSLSSEAKDWMNGAIASADAGEPLKEFPSSKEKKNGKEKEVKAKTTKKKKVEKKMEKEEEKESEKEPEKEEEPEEEIGKEPEQEEESKKVKKIKKQKRDKNQSVTYRIRYWACVDPGLTKDQILEKVKAEGHDPKSGTLAISYGDAHTVMGILKELGKLK